MEHTKIPSPENGLPSIIKDIMGKILDVKKECPGVYYIVIQSSFLAREYYVVTTNTPVISERAKKYGKSFPKYPETLLYPMDNLYSGYKIIEHEIEKYRTELGISPPEKQLLRTLEAFGMDYHPEYFGHHPIPCITPFGRTLKHQALDNGIYWLETEQSRDLCAICYSIWNSELSKYAISLSEQLEQDRSLGIHNTCGYLFFSEQDSCVPIYEMLLTRPKWEQEGKINVAALMNTIWSCHPEYAVTFNIWEQAGLNNILFHLLPDINTDVEQAQTLKSIILLSPESGTNYLHI